MASRKRITSHKKSRQQQEFLGEEFLGIAQRREEPEVYEAYRDMTPARKIRLLNVLE